MEQEELCDSLPYIDDTLTDEDTNPHQYNLKIIENYHNKNRNIEITNRFPNDLDKSLSPAAPLADETEFSDCKLSDSAEDNCCKRERVFRAKESGMKLVIKGWNSSVSIQGLDNKSSITFKRKCEKAHKKLDRNDKSKQNVDEAKALEKSRKGKWRMLTRSIMLAKSTRFERKGLDERYPKYVLLKNEEEELPPVKENYPKMFVFNEENPKPKKNSEPKTEFSFKKSFKNKTEPIVPLNEILAKTDKTQSEKFKTKAQDDVKTQKRPLTERNFRTKKSFERRKSLSVEKKGGEPKTQNITAPSFLQGQVYSEIQNIIEDTLKLAPQGFQEQQHQTEKCVECSSAPPQFTCHGPHCYVVPHNQHQPLITSQVYNKFNTQTSSEYSDLNQEKSMEGVLDLESLPFGILSSFFPRVVIMNAIPGEGLHEDETLNNELELNNYQLPIKVEKEPGDDILKISETLEVPHQDLTLKSKAVQPEPDFCLEEDCPVLNEDQKTKSEDSDTTEYLHYSKQSEDDNVKSTITQKPNVFQCDGEFEPPGNEAVDRPQIPTPPPKYESKEKEDKSFTSVNKFKIDDVDENSENLSLTKIGYKMYDNLTKLSLNREKEMSKKTEATGCGCNGNGTKKSPYNITLESNNSVVKVTVPENELNFEIVNSEGRDIQIGVLRGGKEKEDEEEIKKIVRKSELWHTDDDTRRALVLKNENWEGDASTGFQKFKVTLPDNKEIVLSIETNEREKKENKIKEKLTREVKVGTDDFDKGGGDFVCSLGGSKNLSPRIGKLLKELHEKLEADGKERKFLDEKITQKLIDEKFQRGILPGVFLVKHISPRPNAIKKPPQVSSFRKPKNESRESARQLREYYCEECLATMRIFEDENPSVKSMVDKFETIIQLESY